MGAGEYLDSVIQPDLARPGEILDFKPIQQAATLKNLAKTI
jgi:hypothetical protein